MMLLYRLLLLTILVSSLCIAQNNRNGSIIEGVIKDSLTQQPMPKVNIRLDFTATGVATDAQGHFTIFIPAQDHTLSFTHVGYKPTRMRIDGSKWKGPLNISLQPLSQELEEVVISSQSLEKNVQRPLLGVNTISIKTLKKMPAFMGETDVLRSLQFLPGVTSVGEASNGVNVRGGTTDQNLILMDDAPILNPTHLFGLFSVFPPDAVNGVELYKGGVPSRYGGRVASVLDISLRLPSTEKFTLQGGISPVANRITLDIPLIKDKIGVLIAGRAAFNDFWFQLGSAKLDKVKANFGDLAVKLFYKLNQNNTLSYTGYLSKDFFQTDLLGTVANVNATATQYDYAMQNHTLKWFHSFGQRFNVQTVLVSSDFTPKTLLPELNRDNKVSINSEVKFTQLKTSFGYIPNERHKSEFGISAIRYVNSPGSLIPGSSTTVNARIVPDEYGLETGIFADDEWTVNKKLSVMGGLRYSLYAQLGAATNRIYREGESKDEYSVTDTEVLSSGQFGKTYGGFEPRFSMKYSLNDNSSVKVGYNLMRQYMQVISNTTTPLPTSRWKTADQHVKPQMSNMFSAGYFHDFPNNIYEISVEGYYRQTQNILDYKPGADFALQQYLETEILTGKNKAYGLEIMAAKKKGELTGWFTYTYSRTLNQVYEGAGARLNVNGGAWYAANYDRPHSFNATMSLVADPINTFSFNFSYSTGRPFTTPQGSVFYEGAAYPFYPVRNNDRIKDYHRLDFSWTIDNPKRRNLKRWKGSWVFTVYNLYGRKNAYSVFLRSQGRNLNPYQLTIFGSQFVSLAYNFKF